MSDNRWSPSFYQRITRIVRGPFQDVPEGIERLYLACGHVFDAHVIRSMNGHPAFQRSIGRTYPCRRCIKGEEPDFTGPPSVEPPFRMAKMSLQPVEHVDFPAHPPLTGADAPPVIELGAPFPAPQPEDPVFTTADAFVDGEVQPTYTVWFQLGNGRRLYVEMGPRGRRSLELCLLELAMLDASREGK